MLRRIRIKGATIVSMDPKIGIIDSGDLLIDGGKIVAVGRNLGSWAVIEIDGRGMIAMPGFVNGHIHLWQTALRGIAADWTLDHYFSVLIGKVVGLYTPQDAYIGNLVGALDQINSGVTTLFDWCHIVNTPAHADAAVDALKEAGIRAIFAYGTPMTLFGTKEPHPADARRMRHERLSSSEALVTMALAIRGTDFAPGTAEADISFARDLGVIASFHVACAKHGPRPQSMQSLAQQGLLGKDINLVHANFLSADEFRLVANHGATVSVTPEVEMQMGLGLPPTGAVLAAGAELNIGTDVVTGVSTDMFTQMRFLIQTQRALANDEFHKREVMPDKLRNHRRRRARTRDHQRRPLLRPRPQDRLAHARKGGRCRAAAPERHQHAGGVRSDRGHRAARRRGQCRYRHCRRQHRQAERKAHLRRTAAAASGAGTIVRAAARRLRARFGGVALANVEL